MTGAREKVERFFVAQRLSRREKQHLNLHEAFLNIIPGIEDLADAKERAFDVAAGESVEPSGEPLFPFTEPRLTLLATGRVPADETVPA